MQKVFWDNPYQTILHTQIIRIQGNEILCAQTIAYCFAGGQESDKAFINDKPIVNSRHDGNLIWYELMPDHGLHEQDHVVMTIDWPRRLKLMRLHFAAELILEIVTQKFGYEKVGAHISEIKSRIDFKSEQNISHHFQEILTTYNDVVAKNLTIQKDYSDIKNQRRFWKVEGFAQVPCGGTHVNTTGEVGYVTLKREKPGKGIERIEIKLITTDNH